MKKILIILSTIFALSSFIYAQDAVEVEETGSGSAALPMKLGVFANVQPVVGELAEFTSLNAGGGISFELGIPLPINLGFGVVTQAIFNVNPVKSEKLSSLMNFQYNAGVYINVPFGNSGFSFHPDLTYGLICYFPKAGSEYEDTLKSAYLDQVITCDLGFRFSHEKLLNNKMELELAPTVSICPEKDKVVTLIGGKAGVLFRVK